MYQGCGKRIYKQKDPSSITDETDGFFYQPKDGNGRTWIQALCGFANEEGYRDCGYQGHWGGVRYPCWALCRRCMIKNGIMW